MMGICDLQVCHYLYVIPKTSSNKSTRNTKRTKNGSTELREQQAHNIFEGGLNYPMFDLVIESDASENHLTCDHMSPAQSVVCGRRNTSSHAWCLQSTIIIMCLWLHGKLLAHPSAYSRIPRNDSTPKCLVTKRLKQMLRMCCWGYHCLSKMICQELCCTQTWEWIHFAIYFESADVW